MLTLALQKKKKRKNHKTKPTLDRKKVCWKKGAQTQTLSPK